MGQGTGDTEKRRNGDEEQKCQQIFTHHALRLYASRFYALRSTHFGANAPPTTTQFHALRITLYALRFTHHALRITLYAPIFQIRQFCRQIGQIPHHESRFRWLSNDPRSRNNIVAEKINPPI